jgi:hypothetical protein
MQSLVGANREARAYPTAQRNLVRPSLEAIVALVADTFRADESQLRRRSHDPARKALARLLSHEAGLPFTIVGDWMGISGPAVAHLARKAVELEQRDPEFAARIHHIGEHSTRPRSMPAHDETPAEANETGRGDAEIGRGPVGRSDDSESQYFSCHPFCDPFCQPRPQISSLYPTLRTVRITRGCPGFASSLRRSSAT